MRVLVCGGRDYSDASRMDNMLTWISILSYCSISEIMHGGARGADYLAGEWAKQNLVPVRVFPADWEKHGKGAGPIRNQQMLVHGKPDMVVAFPGGRGTADMVRRARDAGVDVLELKPRIPG